ncbi:hypothetical protein [Methylobacter sp.]|uniref:hypothetical protein n=1 Tax=Methylobacter sp. TaxID=2051955 RepID=UPI002FDD2F25
MGHKPFTLTVDDRYNPIYRFKSASAYNDEDKYYGLLFSAKQLGCLPPDLYATYDELDKRITGRVIAQWNRQLAFDREFKSHLTARNNSLSTTDKLDSWRNASESERTRLSKIMADRADKPGLDATELNDCISNTAGDGGLDYLTISQTAAVCIMQK